MDKNTKNVFDQDFSSENVNGVLTSESFNTYSKLRGTKIRFNLKLFSLYLVVISLLVASAVIFASTIKTAYFGKTDETESAYEKMNTIKTNYQNNAVIKVEPITSELSNLFEIPVGMKIVELDFDNPLFKGLKLNDIIISISGKDVKSISDIENFIGQMNEDSFITYTIYRNGTYQTINPFDESN